MPAPHTDWTAELARALPEDGNRHEVLDGELFVSPSPSWDHQRAVKALALRLDPYVRTHALGEVILSPADVEFSSRRLLQPDLFVVPALASGIARSWPDVRSLLLAIEVTAPSTARADRRDKRQIYQGERVPQYWIVDLDARLVERWLPDDARPEILIESLTWQPASTLQPLVIDLPSFFVECLGVPPRPTDEDTATSR